MPHRSFIAAELQEWRRRLAEIALSCAGSYAADEQMRLRELSFMMSSAPAAWAHGLTLPMAGKSKPLAATGSALAVILKLIEGANGGYQLSYGGGAHLASVVLPGQVEETTGSGDSAALAMIGALALALADASNGGPVTADVQERRSAHLN